MQASPVAKEWPRERIEALLQARPKAVERALLVLSARQLPSEQDSHTTWASNGEGFSRVDAGPMQALAEQIRRGQRLSSTQLRYLRVPCRKGSTSSRIGKYWRQLQRAIVARQQAKEKEHSHD